ncbi:hypothetical protein [Sphingobium sp.]|uniref:hypothetical protein n=1 Tax=Sphingobium sp. TaxID=1912891 RepID=UPI002E1FAF1B
MSTYSVIFRASVPDWILERAEAESEAPARSWLLSQSWYERRQIPWDGGVTLAPHHEASLTTHDVCLRLDCPRTARPRCGTLSLEINVTRQVLDLPGGAVCHHRRAGPSGMLAQGSFSTVRGNSVIGPVPDGWPIDRTLNGYSHHLGSYGQGGVGLSGWQLNGGSWLVLPLKSSDSWIWLTHEALTPASDYFSLAAHIDHRIVGVHPDQLADFPPWEHRYAGHHQIRDLPDFSSERARVAHFEASASGFVLEAENGLTRWRFAMGDHLPRPIWAGSREHRDLHEGESVAEAFFLAHHCYLEV